MSSTASVDLTPEDLVQAVDDIVGAFLDSTAEAAPESAAHASTVTGCVQVTGAFTGAVVVTVTREFGVLSAARMLGTSADAVDGESIADTVGELTNMVGGSVKALLPEPSALSLPSVSMGDDGAFSVPGARVLVTAPLRCEGELLRVSVFAA